MRIGEAGDGWPTGRGVTPIVPRFSDTSQPIFRNSTANAAMRSDSFTRSVSSPVNRDGESAMEANATSPTAASGHAEPSS